MVAVHIQKQSFDGYCVGTGIEYPGIVVSAKTDKELVDEFKKALPGHKEALKRHNTSNTSDIAVIPVDV